MMVDVEYIRKVADEFNARERSLSSKLAFEELTAAPDDSLDAVYMAKAASAEDPELFRLAVGMPGDAFENYEAYGGTYKIAFGVPMFQATAAPDPSQAMAGAGGAATAPKPPMAAAPKPAASAGGALGAGAGPKAPGAGAGGMAGGAKIQSIQEPKIPGASGQSSGGGMG